MVQTNKPFFFISHHNKILKLVEEMTERRLSVAGQQETVLWFIL